MLKGIVTIDFHPIISENQESLVFHPLPDDLIELLDDVKKGQPSFVQLLDNISANDSFNQGNIAGNPKKPFDPKSLQDLKDVDFSIVRDGRA